MSPRFLYKYLPSQYANSVLKEGKLLFRNLTYFRQVEDIMRGDTVEGMHVDHPDNAVTITNITQGFTITGNYSVLTSIDHNQIFAFCLSERYAVELYEAFSSDACIFIRDADKFVARCRRAVKELKKQGIADKNGLIHRSVEYYSFNKAVVRSIREPLNIPFFKPAVYSSQHEYRIIFAYQGAFKLTKRIIDNTLVDLNAETVKGMPLDHLLTVGNLEDIAEVRTRS